MRFPHRTSKPLLRQGIVYSSEQAQTGAHALAGPESFDIPAGQLIDESSLVAMHEISDRWDRLDQAITVMAYSSEHTPVAPGNAVPSRHLDADRLRLAVELGDWDRHRLPPAFEHLRGPRILHGYHCALHSLQPGR
ncbi:hypothetical protein [Paenarthrobacter sp. NPDC089316]|uniref:hypothetical protein n=1 Tax=unclassified Paenarthrobacter TaxID=2634190 RepID=UPI00341B6992